MKLFLWTISMAFLFAGCGTDYTIQSNYAYRVGFEGEGGLLASAYIHNHGFSMDKTYTGMGTSEREAIGKNDAEALLQFNQIKAQLDLVNWSVVTGGKKFMITYRCTRGVAIGEVEHEIGTVSYEIK